MTLRQMLVRSFALSFGMTVMLIVYGVIEGVRFEFPVPRFIHCFGVDAIVKEWRQCRVMFHDAALEVMMDSIGGTPGETRKRCLVVRDKIRGYGNDLIMECKNP